MNHTHTPAVPDGDPDGNAKHTHPADVLAALDPADAPPAAEEYAEELAAELEAADEPTAPPVQLQANLDRPGSAPNP